MEGAYEVDQEGPGEQLSPASCKPTLGFNPKGPIATLLHLPSHTLHNKVCPGPPDESTLWRIQVQRLRQSVGELSNTFLIQLEEIWEINPHVGLGRRSPSPQRCSGT